MTKPRPGETTRRVWLARAAHVATAAAVGLPRLAGAAHIVKSWPAGKAVPALSLPDLDDKLWTLAAFKGRPVILNFWATWCEPCRAEMPSLQALARREGRRGLAVLSVNYEESAAAIRRFLDTVPIALPILLDRDGEAAAAWTPRVFPTSVLIDRRGMPRTSVLGELDWNGADARALIGAL
ncbi:MAG: TlpA family protein disulfide reductase [Pseudomonadota bacterium]|nr:TlpA family protein disulfide reductase [Pseudomonadota bacterium]